MNEPLKKAVLIPCFNEELTIGKVIGDFRRELPEADIYVFNNNSTDRTSAIAEEKKAIVINEKKQGKGYVMASMFRKVEAHIYILVDGDDTYPAESVHPECDPACQNCDWSNARKAYSNVNWCSYSVGNQLTSADEVGFEEPRAQAKSLFSILVEGNR